jgi:hypothetical protein
VFSSRIRGVAPRIGKDCIVQANQSLAVLCLLNAFRYKDPPDDVWPWVLLLRRK